jgi:hypothetical protein
MPADPLTDETLLHLCEALRVRAIAYLHVVYQLMPSGNVNANAFDEADLSAGRRARLHRFPFLCPDSLKPEARQSRVAIRASTLRPQILGGTPGTAEGYCIRGLFHCRSDERFHDRDHVPRRWRRCADSVGVRHV